jgi:hypothetical protein
MPIIKKKIEASKPNVLNRIAKNGYGHISLRKENLSFNNNYIM